MKRTLPIFAVLLAALSLAGCANFTAPVQPPAGALYTNYKSPLMTNCTGGDFGSKSGVATVQYLRLPFWYLPVNFAWNGAAVRAAAREGGIKTVKAADYEYFAILGVYHEFTVRVYGD